MTPNTILLNEWCFWLINLSFSKRENKWGGGTEVRIMFWLISQSTDDYQNKQIYSIFVILIEIL